VRSSIPHRPFFLVIPVNHPRHPGENRGPESNISNISLLQKLDSGVRRNDEIQLAVHVSTVTNREHNNRLPIVIDAADYAVITGPIAPAARRHARKSPAIHSWVVAAFYPAVEISQYSLMGVRA
jgi:hypothetical protein